MEIDKTFGRRHYPASKEQIPYAIHDVLPQRFIERGPFLEAGARQFTKERVTVRTQTPTRGEESVPEKIHNRRLTGVEVSRQQAHDAAIADVGALLPANEVAQRTFEGAFLRGVVRAFCERRPFHFKLEILR